jgi:hypothetical protein
MVSDKRRWALHPLDAAEVDLGFDRVGGSVVEHRLKGMVIVPEISTLSASAC